jgi:cold-inducible RNA-binding protein
VWGRSNFSSTNFESLLHLFCLCPHPSIRECLLAASVPPPAWFRFFSSLTETISKFQGKKFERTVVRGLLTPGRAVRNVIQMTNIFVGNLSFQTTQDELQAAFAAYGNVERVSIVTDRDSGQPRGFAFVEMTDKSAAENAISQLNGAEMNGRALNVNEARPKPQGGGGGGYGGNRGGGGGGRGSRW